MSKSDNLIIFATGNLHKYREVSSILSEYDISVQRADTKRLEIQSDSIEEIAKTSAKQVASLHTFGTLVEDSGLFIDSLRGFPGPYSSYVYQTLGNQGILELMRETEPRTASFKSVLAYAKGNDSPVLFSGIAPGRISKLSKGTQGFGFDPIFIPDEGEGKTFGQMGLREKNRLSHRSRSVRKFATWFLSEK